MKFWIRQRIFLNFSGSGLGVASAWGRIGGMLSPQILYLKNFHPILPTLAIAGFSVLGSVLRYYFNQVFMKCHKFEVFLRLKIFKKNWFLFKFINLLFILSYFTPETNGKPLMQTSEEAVKFYSESKKEEKRFFSLKWPVWSKN